ncbi:MAG TPA: toll/interleukin-1 receptor domain-containing protein, partial [Hanamia sp.]
TAVYNNVLENNLSAIRKQTATSINFSINEPFSDADDLDKLKAPFVFNVFGSLLNTVDPALSEEDMLEYTGHFKERIKNSANIINALKNKNLLFLGCAFPDWMVRFILRLLSNEPMHDWGSKRTIIVVNDMSEERKKQYEFLKNYDVVTYEGDTKDFVEELTSRWKQKNPSSVKNKMVFLSYTVKDKEAVENLKKAIEGINNVTCWYDNREIVPGDDFKTEIAKNIKSADLFIPLISANSLLHKDGYVQLEWFTADNVNTFRKIDGNTGKYLMPVVIDDTNPYDNNVPKYFSELSIGKVPAGNPGQEFINQIRDTLNLS